MCLDPSYCLPVQTQGNQSALANKQYRQDHINHMIKAIPHFLDIILMKKPIKLN